MPDVFLSYAHDDLRVAGFIAEALQERGFSVFWDRSIPLGGRWEDVLERELGAARCCVVLWSDKSVDSEWVRAEAHEAVDRDKLIPVALDGRVEVPLRFKSVHWVSLEGWEDAGESHSGVEELARAVSTITTRGGGASDVRTRQTHGSLQRILKSQAAMLLLVWFVFAALNVAIIVRLYVGLEIERDNFVRALGELSDLYAPYLTLLSVLFLVGRGWRSERAVRWSNPFRVLFLVSVVWNAANLVILAPLAFYQGNIELAVDVLDRVGGTGSWVVAAAFGYYFGTTQLVPS